MSISIHEEIRLAAKLLLSSGKSILLAGAPGTGKTRLGFMLSQDITGLDPIVIVGRGDLTSRDLLYSYEPVDSGFRIVLGKLSLSVIASWVRLSKGLLPRWLLIDELNRMNAEITLGDMFTALDLIHRGKVSVVPLWLVERVLNDKDLLNEVALAAKVSIDDVRDGIRRVIDRVRKYGLEGLPLPYTWRAIATINLVDRSHLFRLGFALLRRFPIVLFPGVGVRLQPRIDSNTLDRYAKQMYKLELDAICMHSIKELNPDSILLPYDRMLRVRDINEDVVKNALEKYQHVINIISKFSLDMVELGIELGPGILADICRFMVEAALRNVDENLVADVSIASFLLPQLSSVAPHIKNELLLGGGFQRANKVQELFTFVKKVIGEESMSSMYIEALRLEIPVRSM